MRRIATREIAVSMPWSIHICKSDMLLCLALSQGDCDNCLCGMGRFVSYRPAGTVYCCRHAALSRGRGIVCLGPLFCTFCIADGNQKTTRHFPGHCGFTPRLTSRGWHGSCNINGGDDGCGQVIEGWQSQGLVARMGRAHTSIYIDGLTDVDYLKTNQSPFMA